MFTSQSLLHIIQHQIHQLIIALQSSDNCGNQRIVSAPRLSNQIDLVKIHVQLTFSAPVEFDRDLLVHIFGQIENILLLWLLGGPSAATTSTTAMIPSSGCTAAATEVTSLGHVAWMGGKREV